MSILLEQLASIDPGIDSVHCAGFRTCLVAIAQRIQTEPACSMLSLNDWLQWLDDEGYEREGFAAILQQICEHELGDQASTDLWSHGRAIAASADGISNLITHVHSVHPGLEQRMTELEALALEEESQIQHTAGGITRAGKIALYSAAGAVVVVGGIGIGVGVKKYLRRRAQRLEHQVLEGIQDREERVTEHLVNEADTQEGKLDEKCESWVADNQKLAREYVLEQKSIPLKGFRLSDLNDDQLHICAQGLVARLLISGMKGPDGIPHSEFGSEISTRLLKFDRPYFYLHEFRKWAIENGGKGLERDVNSPSELPMDLRHEFEGSRHARDLFLDPNLLEKGLQHVLNNKHTTKYYCDLLKAQRRIIEKAKSEGALEPGMDWLDKNVKCDFSDEAAREMLNDIGDSVFHQAINRDLNVTALFLDLSRNKFQLEDFDKCREAQEIVANHAGDFLSAETRVLRTALKDLTLSLSSARSDFSTYLRSTYIEERKALDTKIKKAIEEDIKNKLVDELEKLDDIRDWLAKRDFKKDFESYLESEAAKFFRDALNAARESIKKSEMDAEKAVEQSVEIL